MKKKDYCNYDWFHILKKWQDMGRVGLTVHALATLCKRSPYQILRELVACEWTSWQHCDFVKATVFNVDDYPYDAGDPLDGNEYETADGPTGYQRPMYDIEKCREQLRTYPWPLYKNIVIGVGKKQLSFCNEDDYYDDSDCACCCFSCCDCDGKAVVIPKNDLTRTKLLGFIKGASQIWTSPKRKVTH